MSFAARQHSEEHTLLRQALALLPKLPDTIEVISEDGGTLPLTLAAVEGTIIYAYGNRDLVRDDLMLEARPRAESGDGHDIRFKILRSYFQSGDELLLHLKVIEVEERSGERAVRARPAGRPGGAPGAVRPRAARPASSSTSGWSTSARAGVAFIADRAFSTGDILEVFADVDGTSVRVGVPGRRLDPGGLRPPPRQAARSPTILPSDRHVLTELAAQVDAQDSAAGRRPDVVEQLERARTQRTLNSSTQRRYPSL